MTAASTLSTTTLSGEQQACARYEYDEAHKLVPDPTCSCPAGEMPDPENMDECQDEYLIFIYFYQHSFFGRVIVFS
ncbi:unnamed protein product [Gongylonema pulchrum]|uniref:Uncharacterized protein n=1 Tax=Gongylonema pulchrum TaxID=637853 RepID=A0A183E8S2_9BILA|nr:unnamed protein product [Gongylonema pulchrum]